MREQSVEELVLWEDEADLTNGAVIPLSGLGSKPCPAEQGKSPQESGKQRMKSRHGDYGKKRREGRLLPGLVRSQVHEFLRHRRSWTFNTPTQEAPSPPFPAEPVSILAGVTSPMNQGGVGGM